MDGFPLLNPVSWFVKSLHNLKSEYCPVVIMAGLASSHNVSLVGQPGTNTSHQPLGLYYRLVNELYHVYIYILYDMDGRTVKLHTLYIHRDGSIVGSDFSAV